MKGWMINNWVCNRILYSANVNSWCSANSFWSRTIYLLSRKSMTLMCCEILGIIWILKQNTLLKTLYSCYLLPDEKYLYQYKIYNVIISPSKKFHSKKLLLNDRKYIDFSLLKLYATKEKMLPTFRVFTQLPYRRRTPN